MKRLELLFSIKIVFVFVCFIFSGISINAQDPNLERYIRLKPEKVKKTVFQPRPRNIKPQYVAPPKVLTKFVQPTNLSITTEPGAEISIESITSKKKTTLKADTTGAAIFEKIDAGGYKLSSSLEGYKSGEAETTIQPNKTAIIHIPLKQLTYNFPIKTNVDNGEVRYAPLKIEGQNPDGTPKLVPAGGYCVVLIENKKAVINNLKEGFYNLDVSSPNYPEYEPRYVQIEVNEDLLSEAENDDTNENPPTEINLPNRQSTGTFALSPIRANWILSAANWKIDAAGLKAEGAGIALPKASNFRFYKDFEMQSTVLLLNDTSIGFVVRAEDEKNYYLIKLTGSQAENKYLVTASVIKDGKEIKGVLSNPTGHVLEDVLKNHKQFDVVIRGRGDTFQILAEDGTGELKDLGKAVFSDNNFPIGAVGILGGDNSNFEVKRFTVCNEICQ